MTSAQSQQLEDGLWLKGFTPLQEQERLHHGCLRLTGHVSSRHLQPPGPHLQRLSVRAVQEPEGPQEPLHPRPSPAAGPPRLQGQQAGPPRTRPRVSAEAVRQHQAPGPDPPEKVPDAWPRPPREAGPPAAWVTSDLLRQSRWC